MKKYASEMNGIKEIETQGGWLRFKTKHMAQAFNQRNHHTLRWKQCQVYDPRTYVR